MEWRRWNGGDGISKMEYRIANWGLRILKQDLCLPLLACGHSQFDLRNSSPTFLAITSPCNPRFDIRNPLSLPLLVHSCCAIRDSTFAIRNPLSLPLLVHSCCAIRDSTFAIRDSLSFPILLSCFAGCCEDSEKFSRFLQQAP